MVDFSGSETKFWLCKDKKILKTYVLTYIVPILALYHTPTCPPLSCVKGQKPP